MEVSDVNFTSAQVRSDVGSWDWSEDDSSSPSLADGKKAVVHAVQITCFDWFDQDVEAILCPIVSNMGKVTTRLVCGLGGFEKTILAAPLRISGITGSVAVSIHGRPFRWCTNFTADMYARVDVG